MLPQYILEVQLNIRKRIQDNEYQNVLAEICLQVKWCSKAQNTCSMVLSPLSFFVASYLNAALFFVLGNSFTVILNLWRVFFHIIRTAISTFYCIISPLPRKLGINRAVGTSRSRYRAYRRHLCRRYGVREDLCSHQKGADEAKRNRRWNQGCCPQRKSPCPTLVGRKTKALSIKVDSDGVHVNMFIQWIISM